MFTSAMITTLFAEATRMSPTYYSSFSPKLLKEEYKHFNYINQILIPTYGDSFQSALLCWRSKQVCLILRCIGFLYRLLCLARFGVNRYPVEVWGKTLTPYSSHYPCPEHFIYKQLT